MIGEWTLQIAAKAMDAQCCETIKLDTPITGISTDTRQIKPGDLFVCLTGEHFDAHNFVAQAREKGAVAAVTQKPVVDSLPQLRVKDTLIALGRLATLNRNRFSGKVIAVTGSSGKTTVKELLATMLKHRGKTLFTQGNLNNHIGAPLTLLQLEDDHEFAVIELGASAAGEIDYTVHLTQPHVALLNNACEAHIEGFGSLEGVVKAKSEIYHTLTRDDVGIVNIDDPHAAFWCEKLQNMQRNYLTFSVCNREADIWVSESQVNAAGAWGFSLHSAGEMVSVQLSLIGQHNIANAAAAAAVWVALGLPLAAAKIGLESCLAVKGRMKPIQLAAGWLIDDSYNANPQAVKAAIDFLAQRPAKRILVLGDMAELGQESAELHAAVGSWVAEAGLDVFFAVGPMMQYAVQAALAAGISAAHFQHQADLITALKPYLNESYTLLVKGSRSAQMDRVVDALQQEGAHTCC